jgi:hypothetical protein
LVPRPSPQKTFATKDFELISWSIVLALLEISCSPAYAIGNRQRTARRWGRLSEMRHKNGTIMAQTGDQSRNAAAANRGKVSNISNFCGKCCGNFFCSGTISPPMALISGKEPGKNGRLLRKTEEY